EQIDADGVVLAYPRHDIFMTAHQRAARRNADVAETGPDVRVDEKVVEALGLGLLRELVFVAELACRAQSGMGRHRLDRAPGDAFVEETLGFGAGQFLGLPGNDIDR